MLSFMCTKFCNADLSWSVGFCGGGTWGLVAFVDHAPSDGSARAFEGGQPAAKALQVKLFLEKKMNSGLF